MKYLPGNSGSQSILAFLNNQSTITTAETINGHLMCLLTITSKKQRILGVWYRFLQRILPGVR
jgi:hypothetical protein